MSKVTTFSRFFPGGHPRAGEPTYFVEKVLTSLYPDNTYYLGVCGKCGWQGVSVAMEGGGQIADTGDYDDPCCPSCFSNDIKDHDIDLGYYMEKDEVWAKGHTVRAGQRYKAGDTFSPRFWSGRPYNSKQGIIAPDVTILKTYNFDIKSGFLFLNNSEIGLSTAKEIAYNDGLTLNDFANWFKVKEFAGQIIVWDKKIEY